MEETESSTSVTMREVSEYILVEWDNENKFSVLKRSKIVDEQLRGLLDNELIGKLIMCVWSRQKHYNAKVIQCGDKQNLNFELGVLVEQSKVNSANPMSSRQLERAAASSQILSVIEEAESGNQEELENDNEINYKLAYEKEKIRSKKYKNKVKTLKTELAGCKTVQEVVDEKINLGPGVEILKSQLDAIKTVSGKATIFARNLMRNIFDESELIGKSLFGRTSNANSGPAKEEVNGGKRDAIILQTLAIFCNGETNEGVKLQVKRTLSDYVREVNRKHGIVQVQD